MPSLYREYNSHDSDVSMEFDTIPKQATDEEEESEDAELESVWSFIHLCQIYA